MKKNEIIFIQFNFLAVLALITLQTFVQTFADSAFEFSLLFILFVVLALIGWYHFSISLLRAKK